MTELNILLPLNQTHIWVCLRESLTSDSLELDLIRSTPSKHIADVWKSQGLTVLQIDAGDLKTLLGFFRKEVSK